MDCVVSSHQSGKAKWSLDDLDLEKTIEPLVNFIDNRDKLCDQLFKIIEKYQMKSIIPSTLKDIPLEELKKLCLNHLRKLERETIYTILADNNTNDKSNEESQAKTDPVKESTNKVSSSAPDEPKENTKKDAEIQVESPSLSSDLSGEEEEESQENKARNQAWSNLWAKTQMEILELEMRARAIRSLMKVQENQINSRASKTPSSSQGSADKKLRKDSLTLSSDDSNPVTSNGRTKSKTKESHRKKKSKRSKKTESRLTQNPISMVEDEDQEPEVVDLEGNDDQNIGDSDEKHHDDPHMMMQYDEEDSIDRELRGES